MDLAGGDLPHAAEELEKDVEKNMEKEIQQNPNEEAEPIEPSEKREHAVPSSGSSSSDDADLQKADSHAIKIGDVKVGEEALAHLPEHEREILRKQLHIPERSIGYLSLYRYATRNDLIIIAIGSFCAISGGALQPLMTVIFGQLTGYFTRIFQGTISADEFRAALSKYTLYFVYLAIGEFVTIYVCTTAFLYTGEHITQKVREKYLEAILRQNVAFFDKLGAGEITTRITADTNLVQDGISQKVSLTMSALATFVAAFIIAFVNSWKLTLVLMSTVVAIVLTMGLGSTFIVKFNKASLEAYGLGGSVAEEVLSSIRNATAFNTQDKLAKQYESYLITASRAGVKLKTVLSAMIATMMMVLYLNYGLSFWQGSRFVVSGDVNVASVITIMLAVMIAAFSLGNVAPNAQAFATSIGAATKIFTTIDRVSAIDPSSDSGEVLDKVQGVIELKNIKHIYPSRAEVVVMEDVSLVIPAGKTTALVGASGSGKSTIVGLIERWYDPVGGSVLLDGHDIRTLNVRWLRHQISLVSQEPTLFGTSIRENIAHGLIGTNAENVDRDTQTRMVEEAAKMANAHDFISTLPEGYDTNVGERGFLLSGGQKQRIAIARAVVSDPKILLLDEATSALDTKSEGVVQAALDVAARGRTSIVIAHRLSTIKTADNIVVMSEGRIVEQGTHDQLLERNGVYRNLVEAQRISAGREDDAVAHDESEETDGEVHITKSRSKGAGDDLAVDPDDANIQEKLNRTQSAKSQSSLAMQKGGTEAVVQHSTWTLIRFIAAFNRTEVLLMVTGLVFSIIAGGGYPVQSIFFAHSITALSYTPSQYDLLRHDANFWSSMYLMLAIVLFIAYAGQGWAFAICSERLIYRARNQAFRVMLRQDIGFFDREENSAGALTSFLATETTYLAGISGSTLGTLLNVATTLVAAIVLSCAIGWKLALVCTATIPVLLFCGYLRFWILARFEIRAKKNYESSASYACEATSAIRTVSSLTREQDVWNHYHEALVRQGQASLHSVIRSSALYASSQALAFLCIALGFWYGGTLVANREYNLTQLFVCLTAIIFGAQSAGTFFSFAPDMGKARAAAQNLKTLFDRTPAIDSWSPDGARVDRLEGHIEFRDVHFRYPTRPEQPVLRGLNLTVKPGQYVALVGASGCGKSTTIALLERFYDPVVGSIFADGREISSLNLKDYRGFLALVSQEPTLYQGSIRENVLLGSDRDDISDEAMVQACKDANIYDFITSLPDGFSTIVGSKGSMLSGGQKQRVAIARALLRNPTVLLLDEATSALDSESEKVVQDALDRAARGRTTIAVAHRLSTIQKADLIYVIDQGRIIEEGTHAELLKRKGKYFELVHLQSLGRTTG